MDDPRLLGRRAAQSTTTKKAQTLFYNKVAATMDVVGEGKLDACSRSMAICTIPAYIIGGQMRDPNSKSQLCWSERGCRVLGPWSNGERLGPGEASGDDGEEILGSPLGVGMPDRQDGGRRALHAKSCKTWATQTSIACMRSTMWPQQ